MRFIAIPVLMLAAILPCSAHEASKARRIDELMVLTNSNRMMDQVFDEIKKLVISQMESIPAASGLDQKAKDAAIEQQGQILDFIRKRLDWETMKPRYARIYAETFSEEEINGMAEFYKSPAGRAVLEKLPMVMSKSMEMMQPLMRDVMIETQRLIEDAKRKAAPRN